MHNGTVVKRKNKPLFESTPDVDDYLSTYLAEEGKIPAWLSVSRLVLASGSWQSLRESEKCIDEGPAGQGISFREKWVEIPRGSGLCCCLAILLFLAMLSPTGELQFLLKFFSLSSLSKKLPQRLGGKPCGTPRCEAHGQDSGPPAEIE